MRLLPRRLHGQLILLVSCILLATGVTSGWLDARKETAMLDSAMRRDAAYLTMHLGDRCAYFLVLDDYAGLEAFLMQSADLPDIVRLQVAEPNGVVVGDVKPGPDGNAQPQVPGTAVLKLPASFAKETGVEGDNLVVWQPIAAGSPLGWLKVTYDLSSIRAAEVRTWKDALLFSLLWVACSVGLLLIVLQPLVLSIKGLTKFARRLSEHKGEQVRLVQGPQEIIDLAASLNDASQRLLASEEQLLRDHELLRQSEEKYRDLIQKIQAAVIVHGADTRILTTNHQAQRLLGLSEEQLLGKAAADPLWHFLHEGGTVMSPEEYPVNRVLASGQPFCDAVLGIRRAAIHDDIWVLVSADPVLDEQGNVAQVIVTFTDITGRKRDEETLKRLNRELCAISNCNLALMKATDEQALLNELCGIICKQAGYRIAWVGYAEHDMEKSIRLVAWAGFDSGYVAKACFSWSDDLAQGQGPAGIAIRSGAPVHIQDFSTDPRMTPCRHEALAHGCRSNIALPLKDENGRVFGVLLIYSIEPYAVTAEEFKLLEELASDMSFGIMVLRTRLERKQAEEELKRLNEELEERVIERTVELSAKNEELKRLNRLFVGRELRMIELKGLIRELEAGRAVGGADNL